MIDCKFNYEIGKILEHSVVFERVEDRVEKFPGNSDVRLAQAALADLIFS